MTIKKCKFTINDNPSDKDWIYLLNNSLQSSIFCEKLYLERLNINFKRIIIYKGNFVKAGILLLLNDDGNNIIEDELVIYSGILFAEDHAVKSINKRLENFEIQEILVEYIATNFNNIFLALSPEIKDLRPFLWYKYHSKDIKEKFIVDVRYSSYLDISELQQNNDIFDTQLFNSMHTLRKRHLKKAHTVDHKVSKSTNPATLISFYKDLMNRQGEKIEPTKILKMSNLIEGLINQERGVLIEISNASGEIIYVVFYVWDSIKAYYLFGAGNPNKSEPWQGTLAHWEAFKYLSKTKSISLIDFEGVNSPKRGWFKLSFGGELINYYHLSRKLF